MLSNCMTDGKAI